MGRYGSRRPRPRTPTPDFEYTRNFFNQRYGLENEVIAEVYLDETTPHMHDAFIPAMSGLKHKDFEEKLCMNNVMTYKKRYTAHTDFQEYLNAQGCRCTLDSGISKASGGNEKTTPPPKVADKKAATPAHEGNAPPEAAKVVSFEDVAGRKAQEAAKAPPAPRRGRPPAQKGQESPAPDVKQPVKDAPDKAAAKQSTNKKIPAQVGKDKADAKKEPEAPAENGPTLKERKEKLEQELREKFGIPKSAKPVEPWVAPETETVARISHEKLHSFKNHPFNVDKENVKFKAFVTSIRAQSVTQPVIVRPDGKDATPREMKETILKLLEDNKRTASKVGDEMHLYRITHSTIVGVVLDNAFLIGL